MRIAKNTCIHIIKVLYWLLVVTCFLLSAILALSISAAQNASVGGYEEIASISYPSLTCTLVISGIVIVFCVLSYPAFNSVWTYKCVYGILFFIVFLVHVVLFLVLFLPDKNKDAEKIYNNNTIIKFKQYESNPRIAKEVDQIQTTFTCCGAYSHTEFSRAIPSSCCPRKANEDRDCSPLRAFKRNCVQALQESYVRIVSFIVGFCFIACVTELLLCLLIICCGNHIKPEEEVKSIRGDEVKDDEVRDDEVEKPEDSDRSNFGVVREPKEIEEQREIKQPREIEEPNMDIFDSKPGSSKFDGSKLEKKHDHDHSSDHESETETDLKIDQEIAQILSEEFHIPIESLCKKCTEQLRDIYKKNAPE